MTDVAVVRRAANAPAHRDSPTARLAVHIDAGASGVVDIANLCPDGATLGPMPALHSRDATPAVPTASTGSERTMLWAVTGTAAAAVVALCAVAMSTRPQPTIVVQERPVTHAALSEMELDRDAPPSVSKPETLDLTQADPYEEEPVIFDEAPALDPEPAPSQSTSQSASQSAKSASKSAASKSAASKSAASKSSSTVPAVATPTPTPTPTSKDALPSVDCILDPSQCAPSSSSPSTSTTGIRPTQDLPDKLASSILRTHLAPAKSKAKQCGPRHGAPDGVRVQVKLSIAGATGLVTSASVQGDDRGSPLGNCVADALSSAAFPRFSAPSQGVVYTVTL
jgi:hypothetical protein